MRKIVFLWVFFNIIPNIIHLVHADSKSPFTIQERQVYTVQQGDTLYRIAKLFGMTVERLKVLNHLPSGSIHEGQKLYVESLQTPPQTAAPQKKITRIGVYGAIKKYHILQKGETLQDIAQKYDISVNNLLIWNNLRSAQTVRQGYKIYLENASRPGTWTYLDAEFQRSTPSKGIVRESGMGTLISSASSPVKLALHRSAPLGTFIRVYNEGTGKSVTVKIIGNLPNIDANKDVIIKLSKAAGDALGIVNQRFPVFLAYEK